MNHSKSDIEKYRDIINLDRPISSHPKMPKSDRAVQFSPFAALTNYHEKISETEKSQIYQDQELTEFPDI